MKKQPHITGWAKLPPDTTLDEPLHVPANITIASALCRNRNVPVYDYGGTQLWVMRNYLRRPMAQGLYRSSTMPPDTVPLTPRILRELNLHFNTAQ